MDGAEPAQAPAEAAGYLDFAVRVARHAGDMLREAQSGRRTIDYKGKINLVTEMDRAAEEYIVAEIRSAFPGHDLLAEEADHGRGRGSEYRWIIDPLDGTTNYAHGLPIYSVSIGLEHRGSMQVGVVYQPALDEMFTAASHAGAHLNRAPIGVSTEDRLERSLLVTGFPYDMHETDQDNLDHFGHFQKTARAVRRLGSAALDLCYVACGRFDGFWEIKLAPWDLAAGSLIAAEAGALLTALNGGPFAVFGGTVIASNGRIHEQIQQVLRTGRSGMAQSE